MMKLVDMRGLKPRPFRGPGSTPGIGIVQPSLFILYQLISNGNTVTNKLIKDKERRLCYTYTWSRTRTPKGTRF